MPVEITAECLVTFCNANLGLRRLHVASKVFSWARYLKFLGIYS